MWILEEEFICHGMLKGKETIEKKRRNREKIIGKTQTKYDKETGEKPLK